jgi:D-tyrosyl-tRNA(Tyr) deacylase
MKVVIQRVSEASVKVDEKIVGKIQKGLLLLLGYEQLDADQDIDWIINKVINMRIFEDQYGKMNLSMIDVNAALLLVSQFTLHASTKKGNRPSFIKAASGDHANQLYQKTITKFKKQFSGEIATGVFGAMMDVKLINDGPVTIIIDSKNKE